MDLELNGRHVLVTGASGGIGLACVKACLAEGARVSMLARDETRLHEALAGLASPASVAVFAADLCDADATLAALDAVEAGFGPVDALISAAGAARRTAPAELDAAAWRAAMDAKFFTTIHVVEPTAKRMAARGQGAIVNIVGMGGKVANPTHLAGGSANAALMLATVGLAAAYARSGVRVNAINPGMVQTARLAARTDAEARLAVLEGRPAPPAPGAGMALGRPARPEEIANVAVFLASPRASYVNGAVVSMDGATTPIVV